MNPIMEQYSFERGLLATKKTGHTIDFQYLRLLSDYLKVGVDSCINKRLTSHLLTNRQIIWHSPRMLLVLTDALSPSDSF